MTRKISEVLHDAADNYLAHPGKKDGYSGDRQTYSCNAIADAIARRTGWTLSSIADCDDWSLDERLLAQRIVQGLENLGLNTNDSRAFDDFGSSWLADAKVQEARYAWLKFAALLAEEQGV